MASALSLHRDEGAAVSRPIPIEWRTAKDALLRWAKNATGLDVIWGNQSAPQRPWPYVTMLVIPSPVEYGVHDEEQWLDDGDLQYVGQRDFQISMQVDAGPPSNVDPDCDALSTVYAAMATLSQPDVIKDLADAGLALRDRGTPQNLDLVVGSEWINRVLVELRFGIVSVLNPETAPALEATGYFDKVRVSSEITGLKNPDGSLELDNELMDPNA
jgi:hypothetical protein